MQEKLNKMKALVVEMSGAVEDLAALCKEECTGDACVHTSVQDESAPGPAQEQEQEPVTNCTWDYGHWFDAKTYDDVKAALAEAQRGSKRLLVALSKPTGCTNCLTYWRNVVCDGVLNHDKNCCVKGHPIVEWARDERVVMLCLSPSRFPNLASKIMGKEYDKYMHKPTYYPVYMVLTVKGGVDLSKVPANDKLLNVGGDAGDIVDFVMGYVGIGGKPVLDRDGNQTDLKVKTDSTGWQTFKNNFDALVGGK